MHIRTVTGDIEPAQLGITLGHEHLLIDLRGLWREPPAQRAYLIDQEPTLENRGDLMRKPLGTRTPAYTGYSGGRGRAPDPRCHQPLRRTRRTAVAR